MTPSARPSVVVCAGRDPSGGAGVDADAEALYAAGAAAWTVVTTETDQDGRRVRGFAPRDPAAWSAEARALVAEHGARVVKFGLLVDADAVLAAAALARDVVAAGGIVVVDPVLAASGGERFLPADAVGTLRDELLAAGVVATPNLAEAAELSGVAAASLAAEPARLAAALTLLAAGCRAVVLKGGHGGEDPVVDLVVASGGAATRVQHRRVPGGGIHGSGCRHASFLAGRLAAGDDLAQAARAAGDWLAARIASAP